MRQVLQVVLSILLILWVFGQVRIPTGPLGRRALQAMNRTHATLTDWGLQYLHVTKNATILDIGCGGGRTVQRLASLAPEGTVHGIDYSAASVLRVLKPGGTFALIAETYRGGRLNALYSVAMRLLRAAYLSDAEHRDLLTQAGFTDVSTMHAPGRSWICAMGRRASSP